ncbi:MAG: protein kinase [Polyangiaceae bacterium]
MTREEFVRASLGGMLVAGQIVDQRYELVELIATGGMGAVWRARHVQLATEVALKTMLHEVAAAPNGEARFRREALAAAKLASRHVVQVRDFGLHEGRPYFAMELLAGCDLGHRLARDSKLDRALCKTIVEAVGDALDHAHENGVIHRDVKPANIFLCEEADGAVVVKVLDFGVAKIEDGGTTQSTGSGLVGSPAYMSPEQVWVEPLTRATDLWSLGVVAFEMLTGTNPFDDVSMAKVFDRILRSDLPRPSTYDGSLPSAVDEFFARALSRDPASRFGSGRELAAAFRAAVDAPVRPVRVLPAAAEGRRSQPSRVGVGVVVAALVLVFAVPSVLAVRAGSTADALAALPGRGADPRSAGTLRAPDRSSTSSTALTEVTARPSPSTVAASPGPARSLLGETARATPVPAVARPSPSTPRATPPAPSVELRDPRFGIPRGAP